MAEQLFQIGVKALIKNDQGQILVLQNHKGYWDIPGGRMDSGETFLETLSRELSEEAGLVIAGTPEFYDAVLSNITIQTDNVTAGLTLLVCTVQVSSKDITLGDEEAAYEWVHPELAADRLSNKYPADFTQKLLTIDN